MRDITGLLNGVLEDIEQFTEKLISVGYIDMEAYDKYPYKYFKDETYTVDSSFPRLTRNTVRPEITKCEYALSISSIEKWKRG